MKKLSLSIALFVVSFNVLAGDGDGDGFKEGVTLLKETCVTVSGHTYFFKYVADDGSRIYFNEVLSQKAVLHVTCNEVCIGGTFYTCEGAKSGFEPSKNKKK